MRKLFYCPLEPLPERYTLQLSAPNEGWMERNWKEDGIDYIRIDGNQLTDNIKHGSVLDANGRGHYALGQIQELLRLADAGEITSEDVIYFDDFWHPGISALPYSFQQLGIDPKMYAQLWAQSVDEFDFTYPMRHWMRHFEKGIGKVLDGIFVASTVLKDLCVGAGVGTEESVHVLGLPFDSDEVRERMPDPMPKRKDQVIYSSRWDKEKCPELFLDIVDKVMARTNDINFVITTSAKTLRSNDPKLLEMLEHYLRAYPDNLELRENQTKEQYYHSLCESSMQINTADQDFVSFTLLEATTCGCRPLYPFFRSFPEALDFRNEFMYQKGNASHAADMIMEHVKKRTAEDAFSWVYEKYDNTWKRMLHVMEGREYEEIYRNKYNV